MGGGAERAAGGGGPLGPPAFVGASAVDVISPSWGRRPCRRGPVPRRRGDHREGERSGKVASVSYVGRGPSRLRTSSSAAGTHGGPAKPPSAVTTGRRSVGGL